MNDSIFSPAEWLNLLNSWFEPPVVTYNLLMLFTAVVLPFAITLSYIYSMRKEKERRLQRGIPEDTWKKEKTFIESKLNEEFNFTNYLGSVVSAGVITFIGIGALLFFKPLTLEMFNAGHTTDGLNFFKGINILTLGPFSKFLGPPGSEGLQVYEYRLFLNLAAFQFGFLGAWIYFIINLVRSYFTCDLRPNTFVSGSIRMIVGSIVALVAAFPLGSGLHLQGWLTGSEIDPNLIYSVVPPICFMFGFFPSRGIFIIKKWVNQYLTLAEQKFNSTPLSNLSGISSMHEMRLEQEGIDNMENMREEDPLGMTLRTGFEYKQVSNWIEEAWLRHRLGKEDYDVLLQKFPLISRGELKQFLEQSEETSGKSSEEFLAQALDNNALTIKIIALKTIL